MRDLAIITKRMDGRVSFGLKSAYVTGIDALIQKIVIFLFSETRKTFFGRIDGSEVLSVGKYTFTSAGSPEFKIQLADDINNLTKSIQDSDIKNSVPLEQRLKSINIVDIVFDKITAHVFLSLQVNTYADQRDVKLPIGKL